MFRFTQWVAEDRPVRINGDGEQSRGFTYIDDIARGTILGIKPMGYEIINLGGHESLKINTLVSTIESLLQKGAKRVNYPSHAADMMANLADVKKAQNLLGWEPAVSLSEGISNLVNWYLENRNWASEIDTSD
jgi:nucleoside-diphosphate-sugar epimerase